MSRCSFLRMAGVVSVFVLAMTLAAFTQTSSTMVHFNGYNGQYPTAAPIQASDGNFYGTTLYGGANGVGAVVRLTPYGVPRTNESVIYSFSTNGADGNSPWASVIQGADGLLYGTAFQDGNGVCLSGSTQITIDGFSGAYGRNSWRLTSGDEIEVEVWNPQTRIGPATFQARVAPR